MKHTLISIILIVFASVPCSAQWKYISGSPGGTSGLFLAFGVHDTSLFAMADDQQLFRYTVAGGWIRADTGLDFTHGNATSFASQGPMLFVNVAPFQMSFESSNDGARWIEGRGNGVASIGDYLMGTSQRAFTTDPPYIAVSHDGGQSWDSVANFNGKSWSTTFFANNLCILANVSGSIYRSLDSGKDWTKMPAPPSGLTLTGFAAINSLIFGSGTGIFRTTDSGENWTQINTPPLGSSNGRIAPGVHALAAYRTYLFAGTDSGVFLSADSGSNWRNVNGALKGFSHINVNLFAILDTLLIADIDDGYGDPQDLSYTAARSIPEMIRDTGPASVIQNPQAANTIEVYPNPAMGTVTILTGGTSILGVSMLNTLGEHILDIPNQHSSSCTFDLSKFAAGTYFVAVKTTTGTTVKKIVLDK